MPFDNEAFFQEVYARLSGAKKAKYSPQLYNELLEYGLDPKQFMELLSPDEVNDDGTISIAVPDNYGNVPSPSTASNGPWTSAKQLTAAEEQMKKTYGIDVSVPEPPDEDAFTFNWRAQYGKNAWQRPYTGGDPYTAPLPYIEHDPEPYTQSPQVVPPGYIQNVEGLLGQIREMQRRMGGMTIEINRLTEQEKAWKPIVEQHAEIMRQILFILEHGDAELAMDVLRRTLDPSTKEVTDDHEDSVQDEHSTDG